MLNATLLTSAPTFTPLRFAKPAARYPLALLGVALGLTAVALRPNPTVGERTFTPLQGYLRPLQPPRQYRPQKADLGKVAAVNTTVFAAPISVKPVRRYQVELEVAVIRKGLLRL